MRWDCTNLLHWACCKRNVNILEEFISSKYNLNEETLFGGNSPLIIAAQQPNNINIIKLLVNNGADLTHVNYQGKCVFDVTMEDYLEVLQGNKVKKLKSSKNRMSTLAIEIANKKEYTATTKEVVNRVDARGFTPFLWAIYYGNQIYIEEFMKLGADVNQAGKTGITPLMMAVYQKNFDLVKELVEEGADVNKLDNNNLSAISYFYFDDSIDILNYLMEKGAKIDFENGKSALMIAAIRNNKTYFDYFLNKNANVNFLDSDGNSILSYAILNDNTEHARQLIIAKGANIDACGPNGKPPLVWSVFIRNLKLTQFLLNNGANINCTDYRGRTALYYAAKFNYTEIVDLLKEYGAITVTQSIFDAIQAKNINLIKQLLKNFVIYNTNEENDTVIDVAVQLEDISIINLLLEKEKKTFVHVALPTAIQTKNIQLVKLLLQKGANVNRISKKTKQSPLLQAINQQNADIVELLLKCKANVRTNEDPSTFQRALQLGQSKIIEMLVDNVKDINEMEKGKSFLQIAIDENNMNIIMYLLNKGADPTNTLGRLKELAEESDVLDVELKTFNERNIERDANAIYDTVEFANK